MRYWTDLPSTRREAIRSESKYYYTGKKCKHGHTSLRITKNGYCEECQALRKFLYFRKEDTRERINTASKNYREERAEEHRKYMREYMREYRKSEVGRERVRIARRRYYQKKNNEVNTK